MDERDAVVPAPIGEAEAVSAGVWVAVGAWLAVATLLGLVVRAVHGLADRWRYAQWGRELRKVGRGRAEA
ncbi:hypothetical protein [Amycolatopsis cihanbeyliensis]|uniref:hypothetical protein n=1 Tax=Amycolatopsis cihanbeyliensis TaxID=1128664 RepID=UPI00115385CE|nr:hypothetical protein [Amycolatopsis cihanbeyliensis]